MTTSSIFISTILILILIFPSCQSQEEKKESLARTYCGSCHVFPDPSLLNKETWKKSVLPRMAFRMGFSDFEIMSEISESDLNTVLQTLPPKPMVTEEEWNMITSYYLEKSPDALQIPELIIEDSISLFEIEPLHLFKNESVTSIELDSTTRKVYVGDRESKLYELNSNLQIVDSTLLKSPPSWIQLMEGSKVISTLGIMDPNDQSKGQLVSHENNNEQLIIDSLKRPVYFDYSDFNNDSLTDYVICSFGNFTGDLSVFRKTATGYTKHILSHLPGARKTVVHDFNGDNKPDILALMTQGDEQIVLYTNKDDFNFDQKILLRFPPVYGTTYFELNDFNDDGFFDILTVNGDNADYSSILKPYHGIRIFENDGDNNFNEAYFFPMPGASMAMARDYDVDGDLDIMAISFFPDFSRTPERSLIYLQNQNGHYQFVPQVTKFATYGRWLVMETGDYDFDGDFDIIIGAMNFKGLGADPKDYINWSKYKTSLLVLKNKINNDK